MTNAFDYKGPSTIGKSLNRAAYLSRKQTMVVEEMRERGVEPMATSLPNSGNIKRRQLLVNKRETGRKAVP